MAARGCINSKKVAPIHGINITPFIDVVLVLLVVFMLSASETMPSLLIDLPKIDKSSVVQESELCIITVAKDSTIFVNDKALKEEEITAVLNSMSKGNFEMRIFIRGDQKVDYGAVARVIDVVSKAGFKKIALVTKK